VGPHGEDHAGRRAAAASGEGAGSGRASHTAAPRAHGVVCVESRGESTAETGEGIGKTEKQRNGRACGSSSTIAHWCSLFRRVGETGRQEASGGGAGFGGPRVADLKDLQQSGSSPSRFTGLLNAGRMGPMVRSAAGRRPPSRRPR